MLALEFVHKLLVLCAKNKITNDKNSDRQALVTRPKSPNSISYGELQAELSQPFFFRKQQSADDAADDRRKNCFGKRAKRREEDTQESEKKLFRLYICVQTLSFDLGRIRGQSQSRESRLHGSARRCSPSSSSSLLYTQSELRPVCVEWSSTHEKKLNTSTEIIENYSSSSQAPRARRDFFVILFRNVFGRLMWARARDDDNKTQQRHNGYVQGHFRDSATTNEPLLPVWWRCVWADDDEKDASETPNWWRDDEEEKNLL